MESVYGTDPTPAATDAVLCRNITITPLEGDVIGRDLIRPYLGNSEQIQVRSYVSLGCEVELAGGGAAGTAPKWGTLMRACGFSQTITAGVKVDYAPVSSSFESATLHFNVDGVMHVLLGARGNVSFRLAAKELPVARFRFMGLLGTITDTALPSTDYTAWVKPVPVDTTNTTGLSLHGWTGALLSSMDIDIANNVVHRLLVGGESVIITDRKPAGSMQIEAPTLTAQDFFTKARNSTTGAFSITHGPATNRVKIDAPKLQFASPRYEDQDGIAMLNTNLVFIPKGPRVMMKSRSACFKEGRN